MRFPRNGWLALGLFASLLGGCGRETAAPLSGADGAKYLLAEEPDGAKGVAEVRQTASDQQQVVVLGRIGGDVHPWVDGVAAFSIVDTALQPCSEKEGDTCPTPWDYCCDLDVLADSKALVKVVDENGRLVPTDARRLLNVTELQTVVVQGQAQRDEAGNLSVLTGGVYLRP